jgi:hypothetical protein
MKEMDITTQDLERVCRMYTSTHAAARALNITPVTFRRLCKRKNVTPPSQRKDKDE